MGQEFSRRSFLTGGALLTGTLAAGVLAGCSGAPTDAKAAEEVAEETTPQQGWDDQADILVLGGGVGGTITAYAASQEGARVILVEAGSELGGTCLISGGNLHVNVLGGATADSTVEELLAMAPSIDTTLTPKVVKKWNAFRNWIFETGAPSLNVVYDVMISVGMSYDKRREFFDFMQEEIEDAGSTVMLKTRAIELCTDAEGRVSGAVAIDRDGKKYRLGAGSVILATGGFTANDEMRKRYFGAYGDSMVGRVAPYNQGDGHRMACSLGAQLTRGMGQFYGHLVPYPSVIPAAGDAYDAASKDDLFTALGTIQLIMPTGFMVNLDGRRFGDENNAGHIMPNMFDSYIVTTIGNQPYARAFAIFDSSADDTVQGIAALEGAGATVDKADTLEGLADALEARGVWKASFLRTVSEFNETDDPALLSVRSTAREQGACAPLTVGPFYAVQVTGGASGMFGGLKIDENARVIGIGDQPIEGLYATACCAGGLSYDEYVGSLATSAVVGIMAVEDILGTEILA